MCSSDLSLRGLDPLSLALREEPGRRPRQKIQSAADDEHPFDRSGFFREQLHQDYHYQEGDEDSRSVHGRLVGGAMGPIMPQLCVMRCVAHGWPVAG